MTLEKEWKTRSGLLAQCLVVRNSHRCGYVQIPKEHPLYGHYYSDPATSLNQESPDCFFDVHGGVTYSGDLGNKGQWWIGFDCAHYGDGRMIGSPFVGCGDGPVRSLEYVVGQCELLAEQLIAVV